MLALSSADYVTMSGTEVRQKRQTLREKGGGSGTSL